MTSWFRLRMLPYLSNSNSSKIGLDVRTETSGGQRAERASRIFESFVKRRKNWRFEWHNQTHESANHDLSEPLLFSLTQIVKIAFLIRSDTPFQLSTTK